MAYYMHASAAMHYYMLGIQSGDREVGGYAKFYTDEHGNMIITDLRPLRQQSTQCFFEIDEKANAQFLEDLVAAGENPADWSILFHTHPSGLGASMSSVDVDQLSEMASDLPGKVARSMIISQGKMNPTMHEAVCVDGRVFMRQDCNVTILDDTGATDALKQVGFFDKPKKNPASNKVWSDGLSEYSHGFQRSTGYLSDDSWLDDASGGQHDEVLASVPDWLHDDTLLDDLAEEWIGREVNHQGAWVSVIDAYNLDGDIVLIMPDNSEVLLESATVRDTSKSS